MRGVAAVAAAAAVWVIAGGGVPSVRPRRRAHPTRRVTVVAVTVGALTGLVALVVTGAIVVALTSALFGLGGTFATEQARDARRREEAMRRWPDFMVGVRARLAGGAALPDAVIVAGQECGEELEAMSARLDEALRAGMPFRNALERERQFLADPVADRILTSLAVATEIGGARVAEVLGALGSSVSDEIRVRLAHHAAMTQQRLTAVVALVAPWILLALTLATNPQASSAYASAGGERILVFGLLSTVLGFALARRSGRLHRPPRVFR